MTLDVRPCTIDDIAMLRGGGVRPSRVAFHERRWAQTVRGEAIHFLAWDDRELVGHATLLFTSQYAEVHALLPDHVEVNGLAAFPTGAGTGTALLTAAERGAAHYRASSIGLAVERENERARALCERLGYVDWGRGSVVDEWSEYDDDGREQAKHRDVCVYLMKFLR